jgi:SAM-dependent MidA family methyltransferase
MSDPESSNPAPEALPPKDYAIPVAAATPSSVAEALRGRIRAEGSLAFADFMATALYHPEAGYYARGSRQVGRGGDFFTSVSVGPLFGKLLARRFLQWWRAAGSPASWRIIESGAHDGSLAADILTELSANGPEACPRLEYVLCEPLAALREAQRETLHDFRSLVHHAETPATIATRPLPGIAFGNELLDALPFEVVERRDGRWLQCRVALADDQGFHWQSAPIVPGSALSEACARLGGGFADGYRTELRTCYRDLLSPLLDALSHGLLLWPDYGFARPEYYHPDRREGTLRTFSRHQAAADPLVSPGDLDITAHVDFTAVAEAALSLGCQVAAFQPQGSWLTALARDWLLAQEGNPDPAALRQFQTLTHPAQLGGSFHVLELSWNTPAAQPPAADLRRLAMCP